jgi:hypothetical protein
MKTRTAKTEAELDALVEKAEAGYEPHELRRTRGRPTLGDGPAETIRTRVPPALRDAMHERMDTENLSESELVRAALVAYLAQPAD